MRRLPPLRSLEAFVRTARLGSAKAAAAELALSAPALSRRIKALEDFVGKSLFERRAQTMVINADGKILLEAISPALDMLAEAVDDMVARGAEQRLRLGVMPLFGTQRLIPRLPELKKMYPKLHINVETQAHAETLLGESIDAAIIIADKVDPRLYSVQLDSNNVYAIAAKDYVHEHGIKTPADLDGHTLFIHSEMPQVFDTWRKAADQPDLGKAVIDHMDSGPLIMEAAAQGLGIAIMHGSHMSDARDPRLTRLFNIEVESPYSYWFVCRPKALRQRPVRQFHDWLVKAGV